MFPTDPVPDTIGAYKVLRRLAVSGSVIVYQGRMDGPMGFQRICDLKLVPNAAEGEPRFAEELAREAAICAQLNHPTILRMFDFFEHQKKLVLVLEHFEGANLDRLLQHLVARRQKLGDAAVYYLAHSVASALAHAHVATDGNGAPTPVIHRNLHPANIVLGWDGQVRLTGFGLGKILGCTPDTVAGIVKGTPGYMAPEQVRGEKVSTETDVYGIGLLLWSLLSGRNPPQDGTRPVGISTLRPDLPLSILAIIDTALSSAPEDRSIPCQEIEQILGKVVRPETGKSDLVLRIQSAHSSIELEDANDPGDRPTIPANKIRTGQTSRPSGSLKSLVEEANAIPRPPLKGTAKADPRPQLRRGTPKADPRPSSDSKGTANADPRLPLKPPPPPPKEKPPVPKRVAPRGPPSPNGSLKGISPKDEAPKANPGEALPAPVMVEEHIQEVAAPGVLPPVMVEEHIQEVATPRVVPSAMVEQHIQEVLTPRVLPLFGSTAAMLPEEPAGAAPAGPSAPLVSAPIGAPMWEALSPAAPRVVLDGEGVPAAPLATPASPVRFRPSTPLGKVWAHPSVQFVVERARPVWLLIRGPRSLSIISTVAISAMTATLVAAIWTGVSGRDPSPSDVPATLSTTSTPPSEAK